MPYDDACASRLRAALTGHPGISEKKMMGGLCVFLNGNMIGGVSGMKKGAPLFMFRVGKPNVEAARALPGGEAVNLGGRSMPGFFHVDGEDLDDGAFNAWLGLALSHAASLPEK